MYMLGQGFLNYLISSVASQFEFNSQTIHKEAINLAA